MTRPSLVAVRTAFDAPANYTKDAQSSGSADSAANLTSVTAVAHSSTQPHPHLASDPCACAPAPAHRAARATAARAFALLGCVTSDAREVAELRSVVVMDTTVRGLGWTAR